MEIIRVIVDELPYLCYTCDCYFEDSINGGWCHVFPRKKRKIQDKYNTPEWCPLEIEEKYSDEYWKESD